MALVTFAVSLPLYFALRCAGRPTTSSWSARPWMPALGIVYHLGVDGISLLLVLLTTFLMPLTLLASLALHREAVEGVRRSPCCSWRRGCSECFVALDLFLFYVFWEAMLDPDVPDHRDLGRSEPRYTRR